MRRVWVWIVAFIAIGLALAYVVYPLRQAPPAAPQDPAIIAPPIAAPVESSAAPEQEVASTAPSSATPRSPRLPQLGRVAEFVERFRGSDLRNRWAVSDGWSNGDWISSNWRKEQVGVTPEGLTLTLAASPQGADKPYTSGEVSTHVEYRYGYFEARFQMPRGEGLVVGLFTFTRPDGTASWNEIDMELLGRDTRRLELTYHVAGRTHSRVWTLPFDAADGFHSYAFEWRPELIRFYVDNEMVHEARADVARITRPQHFFISLWNSELMPRWLGQIDSTKAPWTLTVACMAQAVEYTGRSLCGPGEGGSSANRP